MQGRVFMSGISSREPSVIPVQSAGDGVEDVAAFERRAAGIDAVLLDQALARLNGVDARRRFAAIRADVMIVLSSGARMTVPEHESRVTVDAG